MPHNGTAGSRVLIADDQPDVLKALRLQLKPESYQITDVTTPAAARPCACRCESCPRNPSDNPA